MIKSILFLILPILIFGQGITAKHRAVLARMNVAAGGAACSATGDLYTQSFEGTGYAANGSWGDESENISGTSVVDEDYTTLVYCGSDAVRCSVGSGFGKAQVFVTPDNSGSILYMRAYIYIVTDGFSDGGNSVIYQITNSSARGVSLIWSKSGTQNQIYMQYYTGSFSNDNSTAFNVSTGTWYRLECYYNASGTSEGWEFRVDGNTVDSASEDLLGGYSSGSSIWYGLDPSSSNTGEIILDAVEASSSGWLGE